MKCSLICNFKLKCYIIIKITIINSRKKKLSIYIYLIYNCKQILQYFINLRSYLKIYLTISFLTHVIFFKYSIR